MRTYKRTVAVDVKCNNGETFRIKTQVLMMGENLQQAEDKIREQFPIMLVRSLGSGVEVKRLQLL